MLRNWEKIGLNDAAVLAEKERTYKGSWNRRGGVGAFMMLARKWDRLEGIAEGDDYNIQRIIEDEEAAGNSDSDDSLLSQMRDLRRYLLLVEAEYLGMNQEEDTETQAMRAYADARGYDHLVENGVRDPVTGALSVTINLDTWDKVRDSQIPSGTLTGHALSAIYDERDNGAFMKEKYTPEYG